MRKRAKCLCVAAGVMLVVPAGAEQWFSVASPGSDAAASRVEVDLDSSRARGPIGESILRVAFDAPQPHGAGFAYRSFVASAQFDCQRRNISLSGATYYARPEGKGSLLGADRTARVAETPLSLLESIPAAARRALLRARCAAAPAN